MARMGAAEAASTKVVKVVELVDKVHNLAEEHYLVEVQLEMEQVVDMLELLVEVFKVEMHLCLVVEVELIMEVENKLVLFKELLAVQEALDIMGAVAERHGMQLAAEAALVMPTLQLFQI